MSLLQNLPYSVYSKLIPENSRANDVAKYLKIRNVKNFPELIETLDKRGYTVEQFYEALERCPSAARSHRSQTETNFAKPATATLKIAILVANAHYDNWADLITPVSDCQKLRKILNEMGFSTIVLEDVNSVDFKKSIEDICSVIPSDSYVMFYFAGHGFELCGTKYMLGVESPSEKYTVQNGVSENFIIKCGFNNKPELFILLLDMCRTQPDRFLNEDIYLNIAPMEEYKDMCNLIIGYATSPYMPAYEECCQPETGSRIQHSSCTINYVKESNLTNSQLDNNESDGIGDRTTKRLHSKQLKGVSLYVNYLSRHLKKDEDFVKILEMVHKDFAKLKCEQAITQKPQKLDNVATKFYLSRNATGDEESKEQLIKMVNILRAAGTNITFS